MIAIIIVVYIPYIPYIPVAYTPYLHIHVHVTHSCIRYLFRLDCVLLLLFYFSVTFSLTAFML